MSDETTLLPCICGGKAETWNGAGPWHVVCTKCGTVGSPCLTEAEAIATWNTRATHGTLTAEQVETAINNHCQFTVGCVVDAQAIADELNAELEEKPRDRTEERLLNTCNQATQDYVTQLERERDEKVSLLETAFERCRELEAERDELKAKLAELSARKERTCHIIEYDEAPYPVCSECGAVQPDDYTVYFCWNCGAKVRSE